MSPKVITLFEHQTLPYRNAALLPKDAAGLNKLLEEIERLNQACGQEILHLGRKVLRANALVGILRARDITFEILPKIDVQSTGQKPQKNVSAMRQSAARNLLAMLNTAFELPVYPTPAAELDENTAAWFELLTRMFARELLLQTQTGLSQNYTTREEALPVMRGKWDIQRQIRQHGAIEHRFDSIYDELTADIPLNQIFRFTVETLLVFSQDAQNRAILDNLRNLFQTVTRLPEVPHALLEQIPFTRLNERFRPAFQLARLFLSGSVLQLTAGSVPSAAFVFDMNLLFERFIAAFLERYQRDIFPEPWGEELRIQVQSAGSRYYLARSEGRQQVLLRPDLVFWQHGEKIPLLVADTKYKTLEPAGKAGLDPSDVYQMLAYALRLKCPRLLLLYPQQVQSKPVRKLYEIDTAQTALYAATLNLHAPLDPPDTLIAELRQIFHPIFQKGTP